MTANKHLIKRIFALALCLCLLLTLTGCTTEGKYQSANKLLSEGKYAEAAEKFESLGSFEDAPLLTVYAKAAAAGEAGQFEACLQAFETLGDFKDSQMMMTYYKARRNQASGLAAETPVQQAANRRWNDLMGAAGLYGQQLLFRDSQQRQLDCYQAAYDMAEGLAAAELFDAASEAHERLAFVRYLDSGDLYNYYAARSCEAAAPGGIAYEDQWAAEDFEQYQNAILIYDQQPLVRDSQTRAEACRQTLYAFAMECAAHEDYTNAAAIIGYAAGHPDADMLSAYWGACYLEQTGRYELAAQRFEIYADFAPEGGDTGAVRAEAARQMGYDAAMALLEEGRYEEGYGLLRSLGDFGGATDYVPQHEFQRAQAHLDAGEYEDAIDLFEMISLLADEGVEPGYTPELGKAAEGKMQESFYGYGEMLFAAAQTKEDYEEVRWVFLDAGEYTPEGGVPAQDRYDSLWYERGEALLAQETPDYEGAKDAFENAGDYAPEGQLTGTKRCKALWYEEGEALLAQETPDYDGAKEAFELAGDYTPEGGVDAATRVKECWHLQGEAWLAEGKAGSALYAYKKADTYEQDIERMASLKGLQERYMTSIAAGCNNSVGLHADGTVVAIGLNRYGQCKVQEWTDITAVAAGAYHTIGLKADGTVVAVGENDEHQCYVQKWTDIVAVAAGWEHTVGLKADGTVVAVGDKDFGQCDVQKWTDIVEVVAGERHTVGLKVDGTVVAVGDEARGQCNVQEWTDIVAVTAGLYHTIGLKADGTVVAVGYNTYGQFKAREWTDIIAVAAGADHTIGLKADGTVVAVGNNDDGQCNVQDWTDIVAVAAGRYHTIGLKADGTVVAVGDNEYSKCNVQDWTNIGPDLAFVEKLLSEIEQSI